MFDTVVAESNPGTIGKYEDKPIKAKPGEPVSPLDVAEYNDPERPMIYVAGPYSSGDPVINTDYAVRVGTALYKAGFIPVIPHLSMFWHFKTPMQYRCWMDIDFCMLRRCDVLLRLVGKSSGADEEVEVAHCDGVQVIIAESRDIDDVVRQVRLQYHPGAF